MRNHPAVLVTGMSGVGKSTVLDELARRGYSTVDTDDGPWIHVVQGEPRIASDIAEIEPLLREAASHDIARGVEPAPK